VQLGHGTPRVATTANYRIPPEAPAALQAAYAEWDRLSKLYAKALADCKHAQTEIPAGRAADRLAVRDAAAAGKEVTNVRTAEAEAVEALKRAELIRDGLRDATDQAGTDWALQAATTVPEWLANLAATEESAVQAFLAKLEEVRALLPTIASARSGVAFLESPQNDWSVADGKRARYLGGHAVGQDVNVVLPLTASGNTSATALLDRLQAVQFREGREPRQTTVLTGRDAKFGNVDS
jgi:hypothetical protein